MKSRYVARHVDTGLFWADGTHVEDPSSATQYTGTTVPGIPCCLFTWSGERGEWLDPETKEVVYRSEAVVEDNGGAAKNCALAASTCDTLGKALTAAATFAKRGRLTDAGDCLRTARATMRYIQQRAEQARAQIEGPIN